MADVHQSEIKLDDVIRFRSGGGYRCLGKIRSFARSGKIYVRRVYPLSKKQGPVKLLTIEQVLEKVS